VKKVGKVRFIAKMAGIMMFTIIIGVCLMVSASATKTITVPYLEPLPKRGVKVGAITSCSKFDYSWGTSNYRAMKKLKEKYGVEYTFLDIVSFADQEKYFTEFVNEGYNLLIGWGMEFMDAAVKVSRRAPKTPILLTCSPLPGSPGYPPYLASLYYTEEQAGYLAGVLAARLTKTKKIGYITGTDVTCALKTLNAYRLGAYNTDPEIKAHWAILGSWADVAKEAELTTALIDTGCDVIFTLWVGLGASEVCERRGVPLIGSQFLDEYKPDTVVATHFEDMEISLEYAYKKLLEGKFKGLPYQMTAQKKVTDLIINKKLVPKVVPYKVVDELERIKKDIITEKIKVPRMIKVLPKSWPQEPVSNFEDYLEPKYEHPYVYK